MATQEYAQHSRNLIKLVNELRALGAQADINLPRIAVIGNQSAGKSSLVEAIADIKVPRAAGTCTRCPMECRLSHSPNEWQCRIYLRFEKDEFGNRLLDVKEKAFGPVIYDKDVLELMLCRAQLAVLNPNTLADSFLTFDAASNNTDFECQLQFSCNVVCLDVSGPDIPDLSFIDLPGIVSNEDRSVIDLVRNLVLDHIRGNTLILLTITMRDDMQNQSAALLAKEVDPLGLRTLGVLTKPDTLQAGEESAWFDVIAGRSHRLHHGYFVTKQPNPQELTELLDHAEARKREKLYFSKTDPWKDALTSIKNRMGVPNLTKELSKLLRARIEETLPGLRDDSKKSLQEVREVLRGIPDPPSANPTSDLLRLINRFEGCVNDCVSGKDQELIQQCHIMYVQFQTLTSGSPEVISRGSRNL